MPNNEQLLSLLRTFLQMVGTFVTTHGLLGANSGQLWEMIAGIILMAAPTIWSMYAHTDTANLKRVEAMPDVAEVVKKANADPESAVAAAASDPDRPKVVSE